MNQRTRVLSGLLFALAPACSNTVTLGSLGLDADTPPTDVPAEGLFDATADRDPAAGDARADTVDVWDAPRDERAPVDVADVPRLCVPSCDDGVFCNGEERCVDGACVPGTPPCDDGRACTLDRCNDRWETCEHVPNGPACASLSDVCADAIRLDGPGIYEGTTVGGTDRYVLSCQVQYVPPTRNDAAYQFTLRETRDVWVTPLLSVGAGDTAVSLVSGCSPAREIVCGRELRTYVRRALPPGTYGLLVETRMPAPYRFALDFRAPEPAPVGDVCPRGASDVIELNDQQPHALERATYQSNWRFSCSFSELQVPDVVMRLTLTEPRSVILAQTPSAYLDVSAGACEGGAPVQCVAGMDFVRRRMEPGTYWVRMVETTGTDGRPLSTVATLGAPVPAPDGDRCPRSSTDPVVDLSPGTTRVVMRWFDHDYALSCAFPHPPATFNPDRIYRVQVARRSRVVITATNLTNGAPDLELFQGACESGASVQCAGTLSGGSGSMPVRRIDQTLDAGTWWLRVGSTSRAEFDLTLMVE